MVDVTEKFPRQVPPLRILHTESSMELGGQEFRIMNEVCGMAKRGHYVVLAVQPKSRLAMCAKERGVYIEEVRMSRMRWVWLIFVFLKLVAKHDIQVVNTHGSIDSWTASIAGRFSRRHPLIIRTRHKSTMISKTWRHRCLYHYLPHAVVTTGEAVKQIVLKQTGVPEEQVVSIPTGVDLEVFLAENFDIRIRTQLSVNQKNILIGTVAFFRGYKGLTYLLDAAKLAIDSVPHIKFVIVGDGPDYTSIVKKRDELGLREHVVLTGYREDVANLLASMDIFVLSSTDAEGLPQSLTQAMAMEKAVVATHVGSVSEIVKQEETGLLVPSKDANALAQAMCRLATNKELRDGLGYMARKHVQQSYSFVQTLLRTEAVYNKFLSRLS